MKTYTLPTNTIFGETFTLRAFGQMHYNTPTPAKRAPWLSVYAEGRPGYEYIPVASLAVGDRLQDARHTWLITEIGPEVVEQVALHRTDEDRTHSGFVQTRDTSGQTAQYIRLFRVAQ